MLISTSCLLLPLVFEYGSSKQCMHAVVHNDWCVTDMHGRMAVPRLCGDLMKRSM